VALPALPPCDLLLAAPEPSNRIMSPSRPYLSERAHEIEPFHAVAIFREAMEMVDAGRNIILSVGEPDFPTPARVIDAAVAALRRGETHYPLPLGIAPLREAIARMYAERYGVMVEPQRVIVTVGASGALLLAFGAIAGPTDEILMADPGYPSNRAMLTFCGAKARLIAVEAGDRFQLTAAMVEEAWTPHTRGVMLASPANPTGTTVPDMELRAIASVVRARGGVLVVDEIYHGLTYGIRPQTALALGDDVFVVNSFSKYYCMTGWRLGWMVVPASYVDAIERMSQHLYIGAPTPSQWAGVAALEPESTTIYEEQRTELQCARDLVVPALNAMGLRVPCSPDGAFYAYADVSAFRLDSWTFAKELLHSAGVAITPGRDFGTHRAEQFVRISFASPRPRLQEALERIEAFVRPRLR